MTDKLTDIKGYFKIETIDKTGVVVDSYQSQNTIMARIPELFAGQASGIFTRDISKYVIGSIAIGTGGTSKDDLFNDIPKAVKDSRTMMFSEEEFWKMSKTNPLTPATEQTTMFQGSFIATPRGDLNIDPTYYDGLTFITSGSTLEYDPVTGHPLHLGVVPSGTVEDGNVVSGQILNRGREIKYIFNIAQHIANAPTGTIAYTEAALYLQLDADGLLHSGTGGDPVFIENPMGQLFSMKTFKPQYKDDSCAIRIEWTLFF